jgi:hypothetical protein
MISDRQTCKDMFLICSVGFKHCSFTGIESEICLDGE